MKISTLLITLISFSCYSQGLIKDKDGYVNVRDTYKFKESKIIDTLQNNHLIWVNDEIDDWYLIWSLENELRSGYVHKSRIIEFHQKDTLQEKKINEDKTILFNDLIKIKVERQKFDKSKYDSNKSLGTDGGFPNFQYKSITIDYCNRKFELTNTDYLKNLYEPNINNIDIYINDSNDKLYISSLNSDGAGSYLVIWIIDSLGNIDRITSIPF